MTEETATEATSLAFGLLKAHVPVVAETEEEGDRDLRREQQNFVGNSGGMGEHRFLLPSVRMATVPIARPIT